MPPFERYRRLLLHLVKWWCVLALAVIGLIVACILLDWVGKAGWSYPWWSLPFALGMLVMCGLFSVVRSPRYDDDRSS
jgi:hypothetical protein